MSSPKTNQILNPHEEARELIAQLSGFMVERGLNQSEVARSCGLNVATFHLWLKETYKGNVAKINDTVKSYLEREKEKSKLTIVKIDFVMTGTAKRIFEIARLCHLDNELGIVYGEAGLGKTCAVKEYARLTPDVILVESDPGWSARVIIKKLHRAIGLDGRGFIDELVEEIIDRLYGSGRLIIIDEAENLNSEVINLVRRIHDHAKIGLLLVGMPRLVHNVRGRKGELSQLHSRSGVSRSIPLLLPEDTEKIVKTCIDESNGISEVFHHESGGNARVLSKLLLRSIRIAEVNDGVVTPEIVKQARIFITV